MRKRVLIIVGIVVFGLSLLVHLPAQMVLPENSGKFRLVGISGSLWQGEIRQILFTNKALPVQDLSWSMRPAALLTGKYKAYFHERQKPSNNGHLSLNLFSREVEIQGLHWQLSTASLDSLVLLRGGLKPQGQLQLDLDYLQLPAGNTLPSRLQGQLDWQDAALQINSEVWRIGSPLTQLSVEGEVIKGRVQNSQPVLPGDISFQCTTASCVVDVSLTPSPEAPPSLVSGLSLLGLQRTGDTFSGLMTLPVVFAP